MVPPQYSAIIQHTLNRKLDIEFGYAFQGTETSYFELLGSRAYQRAINHWNAEQTKERNAQTEADSKVVS